MQFLFFLYCVSSWQKLEGIQKLDFPQFLTAVQLLLAKKADSAESPFFRTKVPKKCARQTIFKKDCSKLF